MKPTDIIGCAGSVVLLLSAATWIPVLGLFFALVTPLPFLYYATRLGPRDGVKITVVTLIFVGLLSKLAGHPQMMVSCFESGILGLILSELYRRRFTLGFTIVLGTCSVLIVSILLLSLVTSLEKMGSTGVNPESHKSHNEEIIEAYKDWGFDEDEAVQFQKVIEDIIPKIYPAMFILGTTLSVCFIVVLSRPLFRFKDLPYPNFGPMDQWQAPELMVWGVIVTGFALFLTTGSIKLFAVNALIVMLAIYVFHGLSITQFFLNKYHAPLLGRLGVYLLIFILPYFLVTLAVAGLFDQWADFRKLNQKAVT
ncbi:MAG: DUF2232 domain-containing protein [Deltaproteobacteria bacterium]|nr:DUF2232 domain-containing protein [Deltaproteobacteria bacterium]